MVLGCWRFFLLGIGKVVREVVSGKVGMGTLYGYWFLLLGVGTMLGSLFSAYINRVAAEIGLTVIGALECLLFLLDCLSWIH